MSSVIRHTIRAGRHKKIQTIIYNCDICGKEFPPKEFGFFSGQTIKVNEKLEPNLLKFDGHYCGECTNQIMGEIIKIANEKDNA